MEEERNLGEAPPITNPIFLAPATETFMVEFLFVLSAPFVLRSKYRVARKTMTVDDPKLRLL